MVGWLVGWLCVGSLYIRRKLVQVMQKYDLNPLSQPFGDHRSVLDFAKISGFASVPVLEKLKQDIDQLLKPQINGERLTGSERTIAYNWIRSQTTGNLEQVSPEAPTSAKKKKATGLYFGQPLATVPKDAEFGVPKVLVQLWDFLRDVNHLKEEGIFRKCSDAVALANLVSVLDTGAPFVADENTDVHVVAGTIKAYFRKLPEEDKPLNFQDQRFDQLSRSVRWSACPTTNSVR